MILSFSVFFLMIYLFFRAKWALKRPIFPHFSNKIQLMHFKLTLSTPQGDLWQMIGFRMWKKQYIFIYCSWEGCFCHFLDFSRVKSLIFLFHKACESTRASEISVLHKATVCWPTLVSFYYYSRLENYENASYNHQESLILMKKHLQIS